jgi:hypothetical protein
VQRKLEEDRFEGGWLPAEGYAGRGARLLYSAPARRARVSAEFEATGVPVGDELGNAGVGFVGLDAPGEGRATLRVEINGKKVYEGPNPLPDEQSGGEWGQASFTFPATYLRPGNNTLTVSNLGPGGEFREPPWVALDYAIVVFYEEPRPSAGQAPPTLARAGAVGRRGA